MVKARIFPDSPMIEWDVTIDEIPLSSIGKEVTVNFISNETSNDQTFFTDANGMHMIERHNNFRP